VPAYPFTLRQLEIFELLCESRSFRLASEQLGISQASVSNQLKALEEQMGLRLLARESGRRPQLTGEGAAFLADLGPFWTAARKLAGHRRDKPAAPEPPHRFKVLIGNYLLKDYIRPKLGMFLEAHPTVEFDFVSPTITDFPGDMIAGESCDLAFYQEPARNPLAPDSRDMGHVRCGIFGHFKFVDRRNAPLDAEELSALPFLLPPAGTYYEGEVLRMLARHAIHPTNVVGRTQFFDVLSSMIDRGACVGVTLEPLLHAEHRNTVLLRHLEDYRLTLYRNPRAADPLLPAVEEFIIAAVLDDPAYPLVGPVAGD